MSNIEAYALIEETLAESQIQDDCYSNEFWEAIRMAVLKQKPCRRRVGNPNEFYCRNGHRIEPHNEGIWYCEKCGQAIDWNAKEPLKYCEADDLE